MGKYMLYLYSHIYITVVHLCIFVYMNTKKSLAVLYWGITNETTELGGIGIVSDG
jgi:hypothetical protein